MPTAQYHLKQAGIAARMALAESDPEKASALHVMALEHYDKAEKAKLKVPASDQSDETS